jgi:hypothetical protein
MADLQQVAMSIVVEELLRLIQELADPNDPCDYDDHGNCQTHGWTVTEPHCPHARAKHILTRWRILTNWRDSEASSTREEHKDLGKPVDADSAQEWGYEGDG